MLKFYIMYLIEKDLHLILIPIFILFLSIRKVGDPFHSVIFKQTLTIVDYASKYFHRKKNDFLLQLFLTKVNVLLIDKKNIRDRLRLITGIIK